MIRVRGVEDEMYGAGRKALPGPVKLWYYIRSFSLSSAIAAILRAVIRCRVHPDLFLGRAREKSEHCRSDSDRRAVY